MLKEGILIQVRANAGVFPKEAKLHVETVEDLSSTQKIEEAIEAELSEEESLEQKIAFDITIRDAQGKELQPDISKGEVIVSFDQVREIPAQELVSEERLPEEENKIQVFHMEDLQSEVRLLETIAAEPQEVKLDVKAEHFSLFIISFIGKNKGNGTTATRGFAVGTPKKLKRILRSVLGNEWYTKTIASVIPADLDILEIKSDGSGNYEVTLKKKMNTSFRVNFTDGSFSQIKVLAQDAMYSGRIGDGVTYELSGPDDDLTLTIKGSGKIEKISYYPWEYYAGTIKTVVIGEGVKKVPKELFYSYSKLTKVIFSEGLEEIGDNAFGCCNELGDITLPASLKIVGNQAFDKDEAKSDGTKNTITNLSAVKLHDQTELPDNGYYHYNTMYTNGVNMPKTLDPLYAPGSIQIRNIELSKFYQDKGALRFQVVHSDKNWYKDTVHKYYLITNSSPTPSALADFKNTDGSFRDEYELIATGIREEYGEIYDSAGNVEFLDVISSGQIGYGFAASWRLGFTKYGHLLCVAEQRDHPGNVLISNVETFTILPEALSTPMEGTWGGIHWRLEPKIEGGVAVQNASTLTLTGSGDMPNLSESTPAPWEVALKSYDLGEGYYVNIGEGITSIGSHVFKYANLQGNLPSSLNRIEKNAFEFSNFPGELKIPEKIKAIPENAFNFSNSGGEPCRLVLNPGLEVILEGGFRKCNFYGDIVLPQGLKTIGASAFQDVNAAESIYIPRSVTAIGNLAFYKSEMGYVGKNNISNRSAVKITDLIMNPIYTTVSSGGSGGGSGGGGGGSSGGGSGGGGGGSHSGGGSLGPRSAKGSWQRDAKGWWFKHENGSWPASKWEKIQSSWYYFGSEGYMASGWLNEGGKWYYLGGADDGKMKTGWLALGGKWYFFEASGAMKTGWLESGGKWYYLNEAAGAENGMMLSNTQVKGWKLGADGAWIP
ncbi:MAG: leucine-rich repeat protein [Johnsonella sp.]|nr:leucine-rich repeat protein [Johnsonella sp.]